MFFKIQPMKQFDINETSFEIAPPMRSLGDAYSYLATVFVTSLCLIVIYCCCSRKTVSKTANTSDEPPSYDELFPLK